MLVCSDMLSPPLTSAAEVLAYVRDQLREAVASARHPWHWPALATALDNRIVVLRDVDAGMCSLSWYTDRRSDKMAQLADDPRVAVLFYHGDDRCQLRLYGRTHEVTDPEVRSESWSQVSPKARANYSTQHPPGTVLPGPASDLPAGFPELSSSAEAEAFARFCVMRVEIERADFLQLLSDGSALRCGWGSREPERTFCWKAP